MILGNSVQTYLTKNQWSQLRYLIQQPLKPEYIRKQINNIIYSKYESWAINKAYEFKRFHTFKCRNIRIEDLILYSLEGLKQSTEKYNGSYYFHSYAQKYIEGQLYKGLTELQPITNIPKYIRKSKNHTLKNEYNHYYKKRINTQFVSYSDYWIFEKKQHPYDFSSVLENTHQLQELWLLLEKELDPVSMRILRYKYDSSFQILHSNKWISKYMSCSEETIRIRIQQSKEKMKNILRHLQIDNLIIYS